MSPKERTRALEAGMRKFHQALLAAVFAAATPEAAWPQDAPQQAELVLNVDDSGIATAASTLEGGNARVRARVRNVDETTARVVVRFRYTIPPDTIAFDEIVDQILVQTETPESSPTGEVRIDPNDINLNPNGRNLRYEVTMNRPEGNYRVRVQVNGNYE
jgi:hypothetical protein